MKIVTTNDVQKYATSKGITYMEAKKILLAPVQTKKVKQVDTK